MLAKVSILVNCYNGEAYLRQALDSIYAQSFSDWEIVFIDNSSTDESANIVLEYDEKLKYYKTDKNICLGAARKFGISKCTGEYIAILDVDDTWYSCKLARQVKLMDENLDYLLCYTAANIIDEKSNKTKIKTIKKKRGIIFGYLLSQFDIYPSSVLIRRSLLQSSKLTFDENISASEEYCLFMQLAVDHLMIAMPKPLFYYRKSYKSLTFKLINRWSKERLYTIDAILNKNPELSITYKKQFKEAIARANYYSARYYMSINKYKQAKESMRKIKFVGARYFLLYILTVFPFIWRKFHGEVNVVENL